MFICGINPRTHPPLKIAQWYVHVRTYTYICTGDVHTYVHLPSLSGYRVESQVPVLVLSGRAATNLSTPFRDWCKSKSGFSTFCYGTWCLVVPCGLCQARGKGCVPRFREERYIQFPPQLTSTLYKYTYRVRPMQRNYMYLYSGTIVVQDYPKACCLYIHTQTTLRPSLRQAAEG